MLVPLALAKQSSVGRYPGAGGSRLINCFREAHDDGKSPAPIYASAGLTSFSAAAGGGVRAMLATSNALYVVRGRLLYKVDSSGSATVLGGIPTDGPVTMARNRALPDPEIGIVSDGLYWVAVNNTLTQVADTDLPPSSSIDVLNGYFILPGFGNVFYISDTDNAIDIDPADFGSAESQPDNTVRVAVRESEVVMFGTDSIEWWADNGATFPFSRVATARIGCLAGGSVARVGRTLAWVANDNDGNKYVAIMEGYGGKRISHHAVERAIEDEVDQSGLRATSWGQDGHTFYALSGTDWTYVYDLTTGLWHERQSYGSGRWKISHVVSFAGKIIAGDAETGALYEMSRDYFDEAGDPLVMTCQGPMAQEFPNRLEINAAYVDVIAGQGLVPGDDTTADPQIMIAMSRDGGATFGTERMRSIGRRGNRKGKVIAPCWGEVGGDGAVFKLSVSAAVARGFLGASVDVVKLPP